MLIQKSKRIFLTTHEGTDGDDLGSLLAMKQALSRMGKKHFAAVNKGVPQVLKFLPGSNQVGDMLTNSGFDLVIMFGCNQMSRAGWDVLKQYNGHIVNIDHHPDNKLFGTINIVDVSTSSVAELMYYFFQTCGIDIDQAMATCLLTGIFTDTGGFKHANTTADTLAAASELMRKGARIDKISKMILAQNNPASIRIWARALENTRFDKQKGMVYAVVTADDFEQTNSTDEDLAGFVSFLNTLPQAKFALLLIQDGAIIKGSLRSELDRGVNVNKIATTFGGGGHMLASGFKVKGKLVKHGRGWRIESL